MAAEKEAAYLLSGQIRVGIEVLLGEDHGEDSVRPAAGFVHVRCRHSSGERRGGDKKWTGEHGNERT